jgi:6-phosphogluconolactonase
MALTAEAEQFLMFVGTYTKADGKSKGIYAYRFDSATGKAEPLGLAAETHSPSWITLSPDRRFLYAANEQGDGAVSSFVLEGTTGKLKFLNSVPSMGQDPCHVQVDHAGKLLYSANYTGGTIAKFPIHPDGSLGEAALVDKLKGSSINPQRQTSPHPHSVNVTRDGHVLVPDLGQDKVLIYKADLTPAEPAFAPIKAGFGPRHIAFHPKGNLIYVMSEMGSSITALSHDNMTELQVISTLPKDFRGISSGAEIQIHPNGKFVYASNRAGDKSNIAVFSADSKGLLKAVENVPTQGKTPRGFVLDPTGNWLIVGNQDSDTMLIFKVNHGSGKLTQSGSPIEIGSPVSFVFVPMGN